jgi:hypothetical protein
MTFRRTEIILANPNVVPIEELLSWLSPIGGPAETFALSNVDLFFISPQPWRLEWIEGINASFSGIRPRCSLLLHGEQSELVNYALLRRLQNWNWKIVFCENADRLAGLVAGLNANKALANIEASIELARKFRIEVDYFLSLPTRRDSPKDASQLFEFFVTNRVRLVSFARQLLLRQCGVSVSTEVTEASAAGFYRSFVSRWIQDRSVFYLEDIHTAYDLLNEYHSGRAQAGIMAGAFFVTEQAVFQGVFGTVPQMKVSDTPLIARPTAPTKVMSACQNECEYFGVCGGTFASERFLYNASLTSARNPYCQSVFATGVQLMLNGDTYG